MSKGSKYSVRDYYSLLGVSPDAPASEIKKRYHFLMSKLHPDVCKDKEQSEDMAKKYNEAISVLLDEQKRKEYDEYYYSEVVKETNNQHTSKTNYSDSSDGPSLRDYYSYYLCRKNNPVLVFTVEELNKYLQDIISQAKQIKWRGSRSFRCSYYSQFYHIVDEKALASGKALVTGVLICLFLLGLAKLGPWNLYICLLASLLSFVGTYPISFSLVRLVEKLLTKDYGILLITAGNYFYIVKNWVVVFYPSYREMKFYKNRDELTVAADIDRELTSVDSWKTSAISHVILFRKEAWEYTLTLPYRSLVTTYSIFRNAFTEFDNAEVAQRYYDITQWDVMESFLNKLTDDQIERHKHRKEFFDFLIKRKLRVFCFMLLMWLAFLSYLITTNYTRFLHTT